jgi:hypothetical protein
LFQHLRAARIVLAAEHVGPERAGIVDVDVQLAGRQRPVGDGRAQVFLAAHFSTRPLQAVGHQLGQDVLLGEILGADHKGHGLAETGQGQQGRGDAGRQAHGAEDGQEGLAKASARLDQAQQLVGDQGQRSGRRAAEQHEDPVLGLQAAKM